MERTKDKVYLDLNDLKNTFDKIEKEYKEKYFKPNFGEYQEMYDWIEKNLQPLGMTLDEFKFKKNLYVGEFRKLIDFRLGKVPELNDCDEYVCPECGSELDCFHINDNYCWNCGQKLNWGNSLQDNIEDIQLNKDKY